MRYPLLIKVNFLIDKIILFVGLLQCLKFWKRSFFIRKKKQIDILCVYDKKHHHIEQIIQQHTQKSVLCYELSNCTNTQICERVYTLCNFYQPAILLVIFAKTNYDAPSFSAEDNTSTTRKCYETDDFYKTRIVTYFLRFVHTFLLIKTICKCNNIKLYWYLPQNTIAMVNKKQNYRLFNDDETVVCLPYRGKESIDIVIQQFLQQL